MKRLQNFLNASLALILNTTFSCATSNLETRTIEEPKRYELYDYDIVDYFQPINRTEVQCLIDSLSFYSNPIPTHQQQASRLNINNRNLFFLAGSYEDSVKNISLLYLVRYNLINGSTTIIFDELAQCNERSIFGYSANLKLETIIKDPHLLADPLSYSGNDLGPLAEIVYEDIIKELKKYQIEKQKERNQIP